MTPGEFESWLTEKSTITLLDLEILEARIVELAILYNKGRINPPLIIYSPSIKLTDKLVNWLI